MLNVGDRPRLTYSLRDTAGTPIDGSVSVTVTDPSGVTSTPSVVHDGTGEYHADVTVTASGVWRWVWASTGAVVDSEEGAIYVAPVGSALPWAPTLQQVAGHVPARTVPVDDPSNVPLNTFTAATTPTAAQAEEKIAAAVGWVTSRVGVVDASLYGQAGDVAAMRAAGLIELSYPIRDADVNTAQEWLRQADAALSLLAAANTGITGTQPAETLLPQWSFPDPVAWGDTLL